jgi:hypothetical protein
MNERSRELGAHPLPRNWLPDAQPSGGAAWEAKVGRIMDAAEPELRRIRERRAAVRASWWSPLGLWLKPAAALAAAALLVVAGRSAAFPEPPQSSLSLGLLAADGDPAMLWVALGVPADPVLAHIAVQEQGDVNAPSISPTAPEEKHR